MQTCNEGNTYYMNELCGTYILQYMKKIKIVSSFITFNELCSVFDLD
jgi:hypothetical protein